MADTGKRVEVRYGAFSCTIEGYDDPVERTRDVLALVQRMIAETPALAEADSGLDDAQFARLDQALADWRAQADDQGVIIIRSGHRIAGDAEDAEVLADAGQTEAQEEAARSHQSGRAESDDSGSYPSASIFSAPAAAVAETAFAASMATDDADTPKGSEAEAPLGVQVPDEPASQAALFAAPAAEIAERAFPESRIAAEPADPDDDAEDAEPAWGDEAASERVQHVGDRQADPDRRPSESLTSELAPGSADEASGRSTETDGTEDQPGPDDEPSGGAWTAPWRQATAAGSAGEAAPLPRLNIFAPPPAAPPEPEQQDATIAAPAEPLASLRHAPTGPAADLTPAEPWEDAGEEEPDEVLDDGAGDWPPATETRLRSATEADRSEAGSAESTENRLAALITRYQSGMDERESVAAQHAAEGGITAAELAERAGAADVADLLAVSAAWLTLADGRAHFNRREVMEVFETLPGDHQRTLEARIKGFGKLVRSGTLVLVEDGAFAMPARERERFRALFDQR